MGHAFGALFSGGLSLVLSLASLVLWIAALVDILRKPSSGSTKIIWVLVILFLPCLGSILYFAIGRNQL